MQYSSKLLGVLSNECFSLWRRQKVDVMLDSEYATLDAATIREYRALNGAFKRERGDASATATARLGCLSRAVEHSKFVFVGGKEIL